MSRIDIKVVDILVKKVDVPHRHQGCQNWNQKGRRPASTSRLSKLESKRLTSRIDIKVVENGIEKVVDILVKKVDVLHRHQGCREWNRKGRRHSCQKG